MKKIISIDGKEYTMKSSAYTQFAYRNMTNRSLLKDLQEIIKVADKIDEDKPEENLPLLDQLTEPILDLAFVMIQEADATQVKTKEEFYKGIESMYDDITWITEVISLAINPLSRRLQDNQK